MDRVLRIAQVLALLWIGYELHVLAHPDPDNSEPESTVDSPAVLTPRLSSQHSRTGTHAFQGLGGPAFSRSTVSKATRTESLRSSKATTSL